MGTKDRRESLKILARRRRALERLLEKDAGKRPALALAFSGEEEELLPFRPEPDFFYLSGVSCSRSALLMGINLEATSHVLLLPAPDPAMERWTGKVLTSGNLTGEAEPDDVRREAMAETGFDLIDSYQRLEQLLIRPLRVAEILYVSLPRDAVTGSIGPVQIFVEAIKRRYPSLEIRSLAPFTGRLRRKKDADEIRRMRDAIALTDRAHEALLDHLRPGMTEYEAQALVEYVFTSGGAEDLAFTTIVASGPNSCILHYEKNRRTMKKGEMVVCDIGARKGGYCADLTRTYPLSGRFTKRQRRVYEVVLEAQKAAIAAARPRVGIDTVHRAALNVIEKAGFGKYFFHGTSHFLGIEAHDAGAMDQPLGAGDVITVEPGIYIASEGIGVRIEDDILITPKGCEILSSAPKEPRDIERRMARRRKVIAL